MALIACLECQKEISEQAKYCPHCGAKPPKQRKGMHPRTMVIAILLTIFFAYSCFKKPTPTNSAKDHSRSAYYMCKKYVEKQLKSPSSASFASMQEAEVISTSATDYEIKSWVDAQNSFGATMRTPFRCSLHLNNDEWFLKDFKMGR